LTDIDEIHDQVESLVKDKSMQNEIAQIRSKALLKEIARESPEYNWTYIPSRVMRNMTAVGLGVEMLASSRPNDERLFGAAAYKAASAWESLARLGEQTDLDLALMNAALYYQIAGYQANAICLSRKIRPDFNTIENVTAVDVISAFLQRLLIRTLSLCERLAKEPDKMGETNEEIASNLGIALLATGLKKVSLYLLSGDVGKFREADSNLEDACKLLDSSAAVFEANLARSMRNLMPLLRLRSTWNVFGNMVTGNKKWNRYLRLLARGVGSSITDSPSVSELWPSQVIALRNGLLSGANKVFKMPTSAGKTRIAEIAIAYTLTTFPKSKCVYIAPYRALVSELQQTFFNLFGDLGLKVSSIIGSYQSDGFEELLAADADLLVATPEKLDLLLRIEPKFLDNVRLVIMDEGQIVHERDRGVKFEVLLTRLRKRLSSARFIFLSAVVPQETLQDFAKWFGANPKDDVVVSQWRPSVQRYGKFVWSGDSGVIRYVPSDDLQLREGFLDFVSGVIKRRQYRFKNRDTGRINTDWFPRTGSDKSSTAAELAFQFASQGPVLVFCTQPRLAKAVAKSMERRLELVELSNQNIPSYFSPNSETRSAIAASEWLGDDHLVTRVLKRGIAVHYGDLPDVVRNAIETDFRERKLQVLIATNTMAQGVNLPIRTVIMHSCRRWDENTQTYNRIPARDYWNIAGRAGRACQETEGTIIHLTMDRMDEADYQYYLENKDKPEPLEGALYRLLDDLVHARLTDEVIKEKLDPEVLALLVEEGAELEEESVVKDFMKRTLVDIQAGRYGLSSDDLRRVLVNTANDIMKEVPSAADRTVYSSTGLSSRSCGEMKRYCEGKQEQFKRLLQMGSRNDLDELVKLSLEACSTIPEMRSKWTFGGAKSELLKLWILGTDYESILSKFKTDVTSSEGLAQFIEDFISYKMPWGLSALIRIATHVVGIKDESQISLFTRFFPSMIKYGVPDPVACWAISAGVPSRLTAIRIAERFLSESDKKDYSEFLKWMGKMDSNVLHHELGLSGVILEDVSRVLSTSGENELLGKYSSIEELLPFTTRVKGIAYREESRLMAARMEEGMQVELVREYESTFDRNAVQVMAQGQVLGYIDRRYAQLMAPDIDCGLELDARIARITRSAVPKILIKIDKLVAAQPLTARDN